MSNPNEQNETKKRKLHQIESIKHFDEIDPELKYTVIASSLVTSYFALPMIPEIISQGTQVFAQYPGWTGFATVTGATTLLALAALIKEKIHNKKIVKRLRESSGITEEEQRSLLEELVKEGDQDAIELFDYFYGKKQRKGL